MANEMAKILVQNRARTAEVLAPGDDPVDQQRRDEGGQSDGEALKNDVERHGEGELEIIAAEVRRFVRVINTDGVLGTNNRAGARL